MAVAKTGESVAERQKRAKKILAGLRKTYGDVTCALRHENALQLLVATILSAQSTDENVNKVTPSLFKKYPSAKAFAEADRAVLERDIHSTGFFRQKAKSIQGACRLIIEQYGGEVPGRMEELLQLPGVARKTANVVLGTWFGRHEGIVVDTHVGRLAERMALTWRSKTSKDAAKIEIDLMELLPRQDWTYFAHALIRHGRLVCAARKPRCTECSLAKHCPSAEMFENLTAGLSFLKSRKSGDWTDEDGPACDRCTADLH
jgi:endonuclease-3